MQHRRYAPYLSGLFAVTALMACSATAQNVPAQWLTPAEQSHYRTTPDYAQTMAFLRRVAAAAPQQVKIVPFGKTGEGRELDIVVVSRDGDFDPAKLHAARRPIVLVQNAIHAGEMDGKDSCLALVRDMVITRTQARLLDRAVFVFIPIYNADGHEQSGPYNRINQNGPETMGWRANGTNLNLNRDYMKADAPETRAFLAMFHRWLPDFFVDDHVTDGADYQYDVTYTIDDGPNVFPGTARWIDGTVNPYLEKQVDASGHLAAPTYITLIDDTDPARGLGFNNDPPRFSTGYMVLENRPGMLVEMHMLKDYQTRVTGNYQLLRALLELVNRDADTLIALNQKADAAATALGKDKEHPVPLDLEWSGKMGVFPFRGYQYKRELSAISGGVWVQYTHRPWNVTLPMQTGYRVATQATPPAAYIVPVQWTRVLKVLRAHQVEMWPIAKQWTGTVGRYHCGGMQWQGPPFEGRHPIMDGENDGGRPGKFGDCSLVQETVTYPAGSMVVPLDQRLSQVAMQWLEPSAPDSAMAWGFFDSIFEQKEDGERYVLEKLAREMIAKDPKLETEFENKLTSDPRFAGDPYARLEFFYQHSPWYAANQVGVYPVGRLDSLATLPAPVR